MHNFHELSWCTFLWNELHHCLLLPGVTLNRYELQITLKYFHNFLAFWRAVVELERLASPQLNQVAFLFSIVSYIIWVSLDHSLEMLESLNELIVVGILLASKVGNERAKLSRNEKINLTVAPWALI